MSWKNLLFQVLRLRGIMATGSTIFLFWTVLDFTYSVYLLFWFTPERIKSLSRTELAYALGLCCEAWLQISVAVWFRRNWKWISSRTNWHRPRDNQLLLLAMLGGTISTVEPILNFQLIMNAFPLWFQPVAIFLEFYHTAVSVTTMNASLIVIDKAIFSLAQDLRRVHGKYAREPRRTKPMTLIEFFRLLEDANFRFEPVITAFHVFTLIFSVCMTGSRLAVLHREKPGIALVVIGITLDRITHCLALYYCGNRVYLNLIKFRRFLHRQVLTLGNCGESRKGKELLSEVHLRRGNSPSLQVFNMPLCLATCLWYISLCSTMVLITVQFAIVICESDGVSC